MRTFTPAPSASRRSAPAAAMGRTGVSPLVQAAVHEAGRPLEPQTRAWMEPRFGHDFAQVRVHAGRLAAQSARAEQAQAYALGHDIVFGAGHYAPGTPQGRHLIAHELAHVVQQTVGAAPQQLQRQPGRYHEASEAEIADAVVAALQQSNGIAGLNVDPAFELLNPHPLALQMQVLADLLGRNYFHGLLGYLAPGTRANVRLRVAIRFTQCLKDPASLAYEDILEAQKFLRDDVPLPPDLQPALDCLGREREKHEQRRAEERRQRALQQDNARFDAVFEPGVQVCFLKKGVVRWNLYPSTSAGDVSRKQRMQISFAPAAAYQDKTVTFLQTLREEGGSGPQTTIDIGMNQAHFRPFYGVDWDNKKRRWTASNEGTDIGFRSQPNHADNPAAYMFDEPYFFPPPHGRVFESVALALQTGEILGALTWGVGQVPAYARTPTCSDTPSADFRGAVKTFYTPKASAPGQGRENYDLLFDAFAPDAAGLTAAQKKQLDALAAAAKDFAATHTAKEIEGALVVGGYGDAQDVDPGTASARRAQAVANHLAAKGVPGVMLDMRPFGADWALYEPGSQDAKDGRNRRVQVRLFL